MTSGAVTPFIRAAALTTASASRKRPWDANQRGDSGTNLVSRHATQTCWKQNSFLRLSVIWVAVEKALEVVRKWPSHLVMNCSDIPISHVANWTTVQYRPGKDSILVYYKSSWYGSYGAPLCPNIIDYSAELHCCLKKSISSVNKNSQNLLAFALNRVRFRKCAPFPPQELFFYHFSWIFENLGTFPMKLLKEKNSPSTPKKYQVEGFQIPWNS